MLLSKCADKSGCDTSHGHVYHVSVECADKLQLATHQLLPPLRHIAHMRLFCPNPLWLSILLVLVLILNSTPKEECYGCKKSYADLSNHLAKCKKAVDFVDSSIRRRIDHQSKKARLREVVKQRKAEEKKARAAEVKERLAARRVQLEVHLKGFCHSYIFF